MTNIMLMSFVMSVGLDMYIPGPAFYHSKLTSSHSVLCKTHSTEGGSDTFYVGILILVQLNTPPISLRPNLSARAFASS